MEEKLTTKAKLKAFWSAQIESYERESQTWVSRAKKIQDQYKDKRSDSSDSKSKYNILWSNIQILKPALYARDPSPEVERRFKDDDDVGRVTSEILERCLSYSISTSTFGSVMRAGVLDKLLAGRGTAWVRYVPHMRDVDLTGNEEVLDDGFSVTDTAEDEEPDQEIEYEEIEYDFVYFEEFGHTKARTWEEVRGVWRIAYLDRDSLVERFGDEVGKAIPLNHKEEGIQQNCDKAVIYEIWDKKTGKAIWLSKDYPEVLDVRVDPLELEGFFPCPKPMFATLTNDSTIPTPDYYLYQDQALSLNELTRRIDAITTAIKVAGVYDASAPSLGNLLNGGYENTLVAVESWAMFAERGGIAGAISMIPVMEIAQVLNVLYETREKVKQDLYEISGMSDIIRGASDPAETATAQQIKSNYASVRLDEMQRDVQRFARDLIKIAGQIIASQFQIETIKMISGIKLLTEQEKQTITQLQQMGQLPQDKKTAKLLELMDEPSWEEVEELLHNESSRCFRIDIETDSTISQNAQMEQQSRLEFVQTIGQMLVGAATIAKSTPELLPAVKESTMFLLRSYKIGRTTEASFQSAMDKIGERGEQPAQGEEAKQDNSVQVEIIKQQGTAQNDAQKAQAAMELENQRHANDVQLEYIKQQHDQQDSQAKIMNQANLERMKQFQQDKINQDKIRSAHTMQANEMVNRAAQQERANSANILKGE